MRIGLELRNQGADVRLGIRHARADGEIVGRNRGAAVAVAVTGDDRKSGASEYGNREQDEAGDDQSSARRRAAGKT